MNRLINIGFEQVGEWGHNLEEITYTLRAYSSNKNILYCFVCDNNVLYVGKTVRTLRRRMNEYKNPGPTQNTNIKINANIKNALKEGQSITIYAFPDNGLLRLGAFHINLAAGLEDSIVNTLNPPWNEIGIAN